MANEFRAAHFGPDREDVVQSCRSAFVSDDALQFLAHFSTGVPDLSFDSLDDDARRTDLRRFSRSLSFTMSDLQGMLGELRTGVLIRLVLQTAAGAAVCASVVPMQHLVGIVSSPVTDDVRHADIAVAQLSTHLRRQLRLGSANPGGWETAHVAPPDLPVPDEPVVQKFAGGERGDAALHAVLSAVHPFDLQFVAYCEDDEVVFTVDEFHSMPRTYSTLVAPADRRDLYRDFAGALGGRVRALNRSARRALGGLLQRVVLDVEEGAIFYQRLSSSTYVMGVTVVQEWVSLADDRLSQLAAAVRSLP
jgi:hypothetical protein